MRQTLGHSKQTAPLDTRVERLGNCGALRVTVGEESAEVVVHWSAPGVGTLCWHGRVLPFRAALLKDVLQVWIAGRTHRFEVLDKHARRGTEGSAAILADLTAPMPGTVLDIKVSAGDRVAPHDPLVILESMKMEMTLSAPAAGAVIEVLCQVGELVDMGALLLKLEAVPSDADIS